MFSFPRAMIRYNHNLYSASDSPPNDKFFFLAWSLLSWYIFRFYASFRRPEGSARGANGFRLAPPKVMRARRNSFSCIFGRIELNWAREQRYSVRQDVCSFHAAFWLFRLIKTDSLPGGSSTRSENPENECKKEVVQYQVKTKRDANPYPCNCPCHWESSGFTATLQHQTIWCCKRAPELHGFGNVRTAICARQLKREDEDKEEAVQWRRNRMNTTLFAKRRLPRGYV